MRLQDDADPGEHREGRGEHPGDAVGAERAAGPLRALAAAVADHPVAIGPETAQQPRADVDDVDDVDEGKIAPWLEHSAMNLRHPNARRRSLHAFEARILAARESSMATAGGVMPRPSSRRGEATEERLVRVGGERTAVAVVWG
ncbi:hypothetical protein [Streptomyces sp. SBT349]|uniref:hypothetical protein n=1 Tax=Streptomyces sp. SBT349 TaxID=1580539 RepID=UPI00069F2A7B|nr:hypothetical protein [Streptomyces sp. SBT349]